MAPTELPDTDAKKNAKIIAFDFDEDVFLIHYKTATIQGSDSVSVYCQSHLTKEFDINEDDLLKRLFLKDVKYSDSRITHCGKEFRCVENSVELIVEDHSKVDIEVLAGDEEGEEYFVKICCLDHDTLIFTALTKEVLYGNCKK